MTCCLKSRYINKHCIDMLINKELSCFIVRDTELGKIRSQKAYPTEKQAKQRYNYLYNKYKKEALI